MSVFYRIYRQPLLSVARTEELFQSLAELVPEISGLETEKVFCIEASQELTPEEMDRLKWLLGGPDRVSCLSDTTFFTDPNNIIEIGPRLHFETANSTNAVSICQACEVPVIRLEEGRRYRFIIQKALGNERIDQILPLLHDKMTECPYPDQLTTFVTDKKPEPVKYIPVLEQGMDALIKANAEYGTGMDQADLQYYFYLFTEVVKRNPTDVEWCDLGNCNSEHSRHHVFRAKLIIDGQEMALTLMDIIKSTLKNLSNSIIAFDDNASAIRGVPVKFLIPERPGLPSPMRMAELLLHYVLTCETHNHPCLWAAYPGAATGGGGRRRDNQGLGRGGLIAACSAGFMGGNLNIPGYHLEWEDPYFQYDPRCESPLQFFRKAVNGAFDDGNQCGEPVILTFFESFGLRIGSERWEYIKPIMFTGGFGFLDHRHVKKHEPEAGWYIVRFGGKAFEVGFGGGAASSLMGGQNIAALDFKSVQRADGEMARKTDEVIRTCIMMGDDNPIETIHDQGAGGPGNVLKEIMAPAGGRVDIRHIILGDKTMSPVAIWVSEFQENMAVLVRAERYEVFKAICTREKVPCAAVGGITGNGKVVVIDSQNNTTLFDLSLEQIFGKYPQKIFEDKRRQLELKPLELPEGLTVAQALEDTFKLLQVGSQEWAVHVVDRSVTPHVVQQQCVGPHQLPICRYAVTAPSALGENSHTGMANSVGTKPIIGLISPQACARMSASEALLRLMFVPVSKRDEIKASVNWMLAAKVPGGISWLYDAALALRDFMNEIGMDADGGKDSLSLATKAGSELVKSPSTVVVSTYAACPDYRRRVQPDFKLPGKTNLLFVDLAKGKTRLGASALAQVNKQIGYLCPDVEDPSLLNQAFDCIQQLLLKTDLIISGQVKGRNGLISLLCEAAFAGNCGLAVNIKHPTASALETLFCEELGFVLEYLPENESALLEALAKAGLSDYIQKIGFTTVDKQIIIRFNGDLVFDDSSNIWLKIWRETSFQMKALRSVKSVVAEERVNSAKGEGLKYALTFDPGLIKPVVKDFPGKPKVAIIRDEGTNSHAEMKVYFYLAGFEPHDITITDIAMGKVSLREFRGVAFPGGFSYKDVLGSGRGEAGVIKFNPIVAKEFVAFFQRPDTFSIGICNGDQLVIELGVLYPELDELRQPRMDFNRSESFESRFVRVWILDSPSIMLKGMAGSILGIHVAHGEGRFHFPDDQIFTKILSDGLAPVRYIDPSDQPTEDYPFNPNGSPQGIAALCSADGRHLAIMPHPERTVLVRQWPYLPYGTNWENSPWLRMSQNAYQWCMGQQ